MKAGNILFLLIFLTLLACAPGGGLLSISTPTVPSISPSATSSPTLLPTVAAATATLRPVAERVLIVSFDGLRPEAIERAPMTNLLTLMGTGAYTLTAQTIFPSVTLPAHASMLSGLCPSGHGVYWNDYIPENGYALGMDLFDLAHAAGMRTVMVVGKEKLRQITLPESTDVFIYEEYGEASLAKSAVAEIEQGFGVMFVHFPNADYTGHEYGWLSKMQLGALRDGDTAFGQLIEALDSNGLRASTLILVTADHGGHKKSHGSDFPEDLTIPWIVSGPGVLPGPLTSPVHITDTAATAAYMLGLPLPPEWVGHPVTEAFGLPIVLRINAVCPQTH